jgi:hypothetical protein
MNDHERADDVNGADNPPELDEELVASVIGKRLLIGLTYVTYSGELIEQKQLHGIVEQISREDGIVLRLPDGSTHRLPPDLRGIQQAPPGTYRLRSTGEEVHDPDFLYTWTITRPDG